MRRMLTACGHDIKFQVRQGFYLAYLLITIMYSLLLFLVPSGAKPELSVLIIFTDPSALGFFFIGGIVLLEKGQNIYDSLFVTPLRVKEYMLAKALSLAMLSTLSGAVVHIANFGMDSLTVSFLAGIFFTSAFFTLIGLGLAARHETLNGFFLASPVYSIPFYLPVLGVMNILDSPLYGLLPTEGTLLLLRSPFAPLTAWELMYSILILTVWIGLAYVWAERSFMQHVVMKIGGESR